MAATRAEGASKPLPRGAYPDKSDACTYCTLPTSQGVRHDLCPGEIHTTAPGRKDNKTWTCKCWQEEHQV